MQDEITILIADDHPLFRRGLRMVIEHDPELRVLAEVDDGLSALAQIEALEPDVVVLDINMPGADGLEVARAIQEKQFSTIPVFLTMHKEEAIFSAALDADVRGFVVKDGAASEVVACIKAVMRGESFFSPLLAQFLVERRGRESFLGNLTEAERRVLRLLADGSTSREIADELFISVRTVEHHREHICAKLNLKGKNALLTFAVTNKSKL
jgi:DNA-binding NarL/FixJ family response regulator